MSHVNIEIKARSNNQDAIVQILEYKNADFKVDHSEVGKFFIQKTN